MSIYTLTYRKDRSQEICVETIENVGKDVHLYFNQEYEEAIKLIKEIIVLQGIRDEEECRERNGEANNKPNNKRDVAKYGCNNRILFAGQRGCGKTSVMRSLAEYLSKHKITINYDGDKDDVKVRCCCLPMVDPSHFDNNNNILLTVITSMFSVAKGYMKEFGDKNDTADREDLLRQFETVFKSLDSIKSEITSYTLESLNRKSDAEDLRKKMNDLVAKYLKYIVGDKESRLVLLIDDIDMSVSYAPEMLEQLRKYLELDNLIILMSANLGQLSNEMREKYSSAFQYTLKDSNQALSIDVEDLATKYLLKLFPTSRRITIERHVSQLLETDLEGVIKTSATDKNKPKGNFQNVILSLIWSKTRLLFIPKDSENTLHPIIPTNLRDLAQFLDMLTALPEVGCINNDNNKKESRLFAYKKDYDVCEHNLHVFKNYVMRTWIPNHLSVEEELVFHNIPTDITEINKHLINSINVIGTKHKTDLMSREVSLDMIERNAENINIDRDIYTMVSPNDPKFVKANKISDIFNQPSNYSYGDLLLMIDKYETYFESEEHRKFTDAIKIYYSILLFETMFFKSQNVDYTFEENKVYKIIPIQRLIGGNVYYPNYFEIITDKNFNQKGPSFDAKRAFYHKVKVGSDKGDKVGEKYPLFAVLYYGDIRPDRYEKDHIYDTTFLNNADIDGVKYVTFDILSILNNMLNPCQTLSRLNEDEFKPSNWQTIVKNIKHWGEHNKTNNQYIPNAILPFYAVDLMLTYLRRDYTTDELFKKASIQYPELKHAYTAANSVTVFYGESSSQVIDELLHMMKSILMQKAIGLIVKKNISLSDEEKKLLKEIAANDKITDERKETLNIIAQKSKALTTNEKNQLNEIAAAVCLNESDGLISHVYYALMDADIEDIKLLIENMGVIKEANKCFGEISIRKPCGDFGHEESLTDQYRNHIIALILGTFLTIKKEKDNLIKELRKFHSVSEIYKHIIEALWENRIKEICIRGKIQEKVRSFKVVETYYKTLYEETEDMLKMIGHKESKVEPISIYKNIFDKAMTLFLSK